MTETLTKDATTPHPLPSGAVLHLGRPPFAAASRLRNALARAAGSKPLTPEEMKLGLADLKMDPSAGGALLQRLLQVVASEDVEAALFACLVQATYEPAGATGLRLKINHDLLDHAAFGDGARSDLYPIFWKAGEAAIKPFLGAPVSTYLASLKKGAPAPESKSSSSPSAS